MVAAIGAVAAVGGSMISANAAGNAADQQSQSAADATAAQERAAAQMREDLSPWTNQGRAANNALGYYLGLNTGGVSGGGAGGSGSSAPQLTYDALRQQLLGQYTTNGGGAAKQPDPSDRMAQFRPSTDTFEPYYDDRGDYLGLRPSNSSTSQVDEAGLDAAIRARLAEQDSASAASQAAAQAAAEKDPKYGSLLTAFHNGEEFDSGPAYDAGPAFSFTGHDLQNEPGYQFGLNQGLQGIDRAQASRGNFLSGAAVKEANRFNQDYAGTKYNEGFNRALTGYNTNQTTNLNEYNTNLTRRQNEWNTNLNSYNGNRDRIYNFLTGVSTLGQNSAAQAGASNQQAATQAGNNMMQAANAQAAGTVAAGNALQSGVNSAANAYSGNLNSAGGWNQMLAGQRGQYQNTGTNYLQSGYDALGMPNNI